MAIIFPTNLEPSFSDVPVDEDLKAIFDVILSDTGFTNPLTSLMTDVLAEVVTSDTGIEAIITDLDLLVITPPVAWSGTSGDIQDIADALALVITDELDTIPTLINGTFLPHTDRLSGVTINDVSVASSNMMILYSITLAWMSISFTHGDTANKIPLMFGSLFTGDDALTNLDAATTAVLTEINAINIIAKIEGDLDTSIGIIADIEATAGTVTQQGVLSALVSSDNAQFDIAMNFIRTSVNASSVAGFAKQDFEGYFFRNVVGSTELNALLDNIEIES